MFSLTALDRPALAQLTKAARAAHGCAFVSFKSAGEANALAQRCDMDAELDADGLRQMMHGSRACYWCEKSLGQKQTAAFVHLQPLAAGGANTLENTAVVCQKCARIRVSMLVCRPPASTKVSKTRDRDSSMTLEGPSEEGASPAAAAFHAGWVYVTPGGADSPWVFLTWGEAGYIDRLQHLKYTAPTGQAEFKVAPEPLASFKGLLVRSTPVGEGMLREVRRAGKVMVLPG